jgi:regulator of nonsense transcripts 2
MINSAFFMVNPPRKAAQPTKEVPPLEAYLRYLLTSRLDANDKSVLFVSKQIQRLPWSDPSIDCGVLVCKYMMKACRKGRYKATKAVASLAANLKRNKPEVASRLIDTVVEEIQWFIENPMFRDHQRTLVCARVFGELYNSAVIPSLTVFEMMHHVLNYGHTIPDALREASDSKETFAPRGKVTQTIHENEELEDEEEEEKVQDEKPTVVPVGRLSKYDPRVFCHVDPPNAAFRIKIVTTILDTISSQVVTVSNKSKIGYILAALQRYLFVKTSLPSDG